MNKLIIVGNGFDLAHGYPTGYVDFLRWLVKRELILASTSIQTSYKIGNPLFDCRYNQSIYITVPLDDYINNNLSSILKLSKKKTNNFIVGESKQQNIPFLLKPKSDFVKLLFQATCCNWVDIEHSYYKSLKKILEGFSKTGTILPESDLRTLNNQLMYLCSQLREYLQSLERKNYIDKFQENLSMPINYEDLFKPDDWKEIQDIDIDDLKENSRTYILNFNYTDTILTYFNHIEDVSINYIHGSIYGDDNPMIFGYGDELDDSFVEMEKQDHAGFLEHVKSLWYLRTRNYHDLIRFIESGYYQVQIIGHSCGRSDRTLLNMVFEHDNCNSIDIHYYKDCEKGTDNFNQISEEISRQFKDKKKLRKRVLPKNTLNVMPQFKDEMKNVI